jgi:LPXTG-motif cell wall-anchored protein
MSFTRRLAAGLPVVGVTALAALVFTAAPASAAPGDPANAGRPVVMATPCDEDARTKCVDGDAAGYGYGDDDTPNDNSTGGADDNGGDDNGGDDNGSGDDDRGNPGYGGESPTPSPSETTPTGTTDTVPPGGESPAVSPSPSASTADTPGTPGGGVSAGGTLPLTGAPLGATITVGAALVVGGIGAVWYTRRRREA